MIYNCIIYVSHSKMYRKSRKTYSPRQPMARGGNPSFFNHSNELANGLLMPSKNVVF